MPVRENSSGHRKEKTEMGDIVETESIGPYKWQVKKSEWEKENGRWEKWQSP